MIYIHTYLGYSNRWIRNFHPILHLWKPSLHCWYCYFGSFWNFTRENKLKKKKNSSKKTLLESPGFQVMCTTSVFHDVLFASGSLLYCAKDVVPYKLLATILLTHTRRMSECGRANLSARLNSNVTVNSLIIGGREREPTLTSRV